jgi:hypothetical protein
MLLTHFDLPAEYWIHLRTTNVIESTFATVKLRTLKTKGAGWRPGGLAVANSSVTRSTNNPVHDCLFADCHRLRSQRPPAVTAEFS